MAEPKCKPQTSNEPKNARIILVDDHPAVLRQIIQLLPERFEVVDTSEDGLALLESVCQLQPDVVVLDIELPLMSGMELGRRLQAIGCTTKIIFVTMHADCDYLREVLQQGALGYVVKARLASDLVLALDAALAGKRFVSPCPELVDFE